MNTVGGNENQEWVDVTDLTDVVRKFTEGEPLPDGVEVIVLPPRDPSVRDVLAQLDRIETMIGALNEQVGALNARMDELTLKVKRVTS